MRRGGWRKRAEDDWEKWGGYMAAKVQKLEQQFRSDAAIQKDGASSTIFSGVAIYVNGYTDPSAEELRKLMMLHGGQYHVYYSRSKTTHIIATNLPNAKIKELKGEKVIRPEWIVESIKAGRLLSCIPYQLYSKPSSVQKSLNFNPVCKPEDPLPGPSSITKQLNDRVNHIIKKIETESEVRVNGVNNWNEEAADNDFDFVGLEPVFPGRKQNGIPHPRGGRALCNGHAHSSHGALESVGCLAPPGSGVASRLSPEPAQEEAAGAEGSRGAFRDCTVQLAQQSACSADALRDPHRTKPFSSPPLHSNPRVNGAHHSTVQGPSSTKSTSSVPSPSRGRPSGPPRPSDFNFISDFYSRSRLHHISAWKWELTEFVSALQKQSSGIFPGREKLKKMKAGRSALVVTDTGTMSVLSSPRHQSCIMHVDMDCFFVSVGIRNRPDLKGKPVAVTSNRGTGRAPLRPGANPQLEWQYYQNKILRGKAAEIPDPSTWESQDSAQINGIDSVLSKAEIASCSYEARQVGIRNGMYFGYAKQLCPNLQAVPYDFHAYKEVAQTMYETLASYTHDIEAVSCDEALVDITEILAETRLTPDEFANAVRMEIKDQTKCAASVGIGSNILLARMATRKAKPDGQYHLKPEEVDDFIRGQLVTNLPGVGRSMESKLMSLGIRTCGDLQYMTMAKLQKEFGSKTGQMLYRFCRGLDDRPVRTEKERKSISAEINYGIRFSQPKEAEAFLLSLSEEIQRRLEAIGMKGKRLTLKIMVRKPGAPIESAKYGGHGICDITTRTVTLDQATDSAKLIGTAALNMFHTMKLSIADMRGVGIHVNQLVPANPNPPACLSHPAAQPSHGAGRAPSVLELLQAQRARRPPEEEPAVFLAAVDLEMPPAPRSCTVPSLSPHLTSGVTPVTTSKAECASKWNGLHSPISLKPRLNLSIEVPSPSQLDRSVLEALPPDLREQVEQACAVQQAEPPGDRRREPVNGCSTGILPQPVGTVLLQIPAPQDPNSDTGINLIALPAFSQVDPEVFAALPVELQKELRAAYDQRQRQGEHSPPQQPAGAPVPKNPLLQLKPAAAKDKKRNKKKNPLSPQRKIQSPLKTTLVNSPAKTLPGACTSPQKLLDGFLKHEGPTSEKPLGELSASTSGVAGLSGLQPDVSTSVRPPAPNLAGAVEFSDVKTLLREWITTISDPMEEDILQVVKYCTDLIEEKDLEKLDLVIKYMKRLMQQSVESVWNMAFDFILDNVQVVLQQTYGSTLKVT
ncbi:DNA repair protein REV1 isoform X1 [Bubalus kerabau]|uniref:DNA repair protein REV1 isoform X1 n=1 Tax=Bubalus bubalis TaxID=89462 RepID=UPI001E1B8D86|nr:DNA repair protein REV1 isoform X1 [Bubalus bubalis]XP_025116488.3 DNA repair protein REV1 isoform X1 [Bubalus bubalis]XP_044781584.2 DNA repair protein REV1 isoform X1 [Bubalus bubalis]XP_055395409.1 DNA repair protein REV1 isoform X1 [Bubalus carabanensis]XP_055395410.1 DNA repair protein REV1 isoform X1 [Bubalus carabanensis]